MTPDPTVTAVSELKPCPFCDDALVNIWSPAQGGYSVICGNGCGAEGPVMENEYRAAEAWNRRSALADVGEPTSTQLDNLYHALDAKQAKIDALMLEFCPGEMSAEQRSEWAKNQQVVALADVGGWRCFHCGEVCETEESAVDHFGSNQAATPACRLAPDLAGIVKLVRDQESELAKYRAEDSESHREFYRIGADHAVALRRAEETGYARGLEDAKKHPETLGLAAGTGKQPRPADPLADGMTFREAMSVVSHQPRPADAEILGRLRASESEVTRLADRNHENIAALYAARAARDAFAKRINELEEKQPRPAAEDEKLPQAGGLPVRHVLSVADGLEEYGGVMARGDDALRDLLTSAERILREIVDQRLSPAAHTAFQAATAASSDPFVPDHTAAHTAQGDASNKLLREIDEYLSGHPQNSVFCGSKLHQDIKRRLAEQGSGAK